MIKTTQNPQETQALAAEFKAQYPQARWWLLYGDLGAGKTTFVKGLAAACGLSPDSIKSPTFTLLEDHGAFVHVDLYRLTTPDASIEAELEDYAAQQKLIVVEWPERLSQVPEGALKLHFTHKSMEERTIEADLPDFAS